MGVQAYVIPYETEEQKEAILDIIKKHNSAPFSNEFVRFSDKSEYKQLVCGEDLTGVMTAAMKKPYTTVRNGPTLSKVVYCVHGGGRGCTFDFFAWELRRRLNHPAIHAYGFERSMEKRMTNEQRVPQERVGGGDCVITTEAYDVRPALFITRELNLKRTADEPYPPPSYSSKTEGYVVGETRFDDLAAAEAHSAEKKRELVEYEEKEKARIAADTTKYKELRAAGKGYYCVVVKHDHGKLLTNESMKTTAEVDAALAAGEEIGILYL